MKYSRVPKELIGHIELDPFLGQNEEALLYVLLYIENTIKDASRRKLIPEVEFVDVRVERAGNGKLALGFNVEVR